MGKRRITVTIDPEIENWLDAGAMCYGRSVSEIIRICLKEFHELKPRRFSTADKAWGETPESWRVVRKDVGNT